MIFTDNQNVPVRSVDNTLLIEKFTSNATQLRKLEAETAIRTKLQISLENEMNFRGLISIVRN